MVFKIKICALIYLTLSFTCHHLFWHVLIYGKSNMSQLSSCPIYVLCFKQIWQINKQRSLKGGVKKVFRRNLHKSSRNVFVYGWKLFVVSPALRWSYCLNYIGLFVQIQQNNLIWNCIFYCFYYTSWQHVSVHFEPCPGRQNTRYDTKVHTAIGRYKNVLCYFLPCVFLC